MRRWMILAFLLVPWVAQAATIQLAWDAAPGATGYKVYYGTATQIYTTVVNTGQGTTASISGLNKNRRYYFAATAVYPNGESGFSNEVNARAR
jgi:hypothetical protein